MSPRRRHGRARIPRATWVAVGVGALLTASVSVTRSFTVPAAVLITIALVLLVGAVAMQLLRDPPPALVARRPQPVDPPVAPRRVGWILWAVTVGAAVTWQLWNYFRSPRSDHPTISSLLDGLVEPAGIGRGVAFAIWLGAAWYVVTR